METDTTFNYSVLFKKKSSFKGSSGSNVYSYEFFVPQNDYDVVKLYSSHDLLKEKDVKPMQEVSLLLEMKNIFKPRLLQINV